MAEYDIIGGIVSPKAQKEMDAYYDSILKIAEAIKGMPTLGGAAAPAKGGGGGKSTAEFDALTEANKRLTKSVQDLEVAQQKITATTAKNIASKQALTQVQKLNATLASTETSELQKMDAQMKLISLDLQKMVVAKQTETKAYTDGIAKLKNMSVEYDRLSKASGASMMKTKSMYGSTFQLTQVMRELPNFAIDARVGFMALSNNLPMLADGFSQLKNEIDATTGKAYGFSGAAKIFAKSLLSLNTIMIVASTLLVLYGKDILDWMNNTTKADKAMESFLKTITESSGQFSTAAKKMDELNAIFKSAEQGFVSQKDAIEEYNKEFGATNGYIKTFEEGQRRLIEQAPMYVQAITMQAYANSLLEQAITTAGEAEALRRDKTVKWYQRVWEMTKVFASNESVFGGGVLNPKIMQKMIDATKDETILQKRQDKANAKDKERNDLLAQYYDEYTKFAEFSKQNNLDFWGKQGKDKKDKSGGTTQTGKEIYEEQKFYSEKRQALVKQIADTEIKIQQELSDGTRNSFEERLAATSEYFDAVFKLAEIDKQLEISRGQEKISKDLLEIQQKKVHNEQLYKDKKISHARLIELNKQFDEAVFTLLENSHIIIEEATDTFNNTLENAARKSEAEKLKIKKEAFEADAKLVQEYSDYTLRRIQENYEKEQAAQDKLSSREIVSKALGGGRTSAKSAIYELLLKRRTNREKLQADIDYTKLLLGNINLTGEKERELRAKLAQQELAQAEQSRKDSLEIEKERAKTEQELIVEMAEQTVELLQNIWNGFYDLYFKKLEEEKDRVKTIETEKLNEITDKEEAGVLTKTQAEEEKARTSAYYQSIQDDLDEKKKKADRDKFLLEQAAAIATIWINWAIATSNPTNLIALGTLTPLYTAIAAISTATALAQTIPYFAEGGVMDREGKAVLGDGGKRELAISPSGNFFISKDTPTVYNLEKGTQILPDINKVDLMSILALKQVMPQQGEDRMLVSEMRNITKAIQAQKQGNFYGMPLIKQLDSRSRYSSRSRSLMS